MLFDTDVGNKRRLLNVEEIVQQKGEDICAVLPAFDYFTGYDTTSAFVRGEVNWLFNVTINDISVIYVTANRCAGGQKKKMDLRSGSQRHRHFVGFFNVPVLAPTRDHPFYTVIPTHCPI